MTLLSRKLLIILLALTPMLSAHSQEFQMDFPAMENPAKNPTRSKVGAVTIFLKGAEVTRNAEAKVKKGLTILTFIGLEEKIDPRSIQVAAPEGFIIRTVEHNVNALENHKLSNEIRTLANDHKRVTLSIRKLQSEFDVLKQEEKMILANQSFSGKEEAVNVEELNKASTFFRERLGEIYDLLLEIDNKKKDMKELQKRYAELLEIKNAKMNQATNEILVEIEAPANGNIPLKLKYYVQGAAWIPRYDVRSKSTDNKILIDYRADIVQETGTNWDQAAITLSAADPMLGGQQPELEQWNLYLREKGYVSYRERYGNTFGMVVTEEIHDLNPPVGKADTVRPLSGKDYLNLTLADFTSMVETPTSAEFSISIPQDIPSDGQFHQVMVQQFNVPATFRHFAIPKKDNDAFLLGLVTDWESLNLMPGKASIYLDGTYVGNSFVDPVQTNDTLSFSFGRDKGVIVQRELLKDFNKTRLIGLNRVRTYGYEFIIRNNKQQPVSLKLQDQIPVSQDNSVKIDLQESGNARHNRETGLLTWNLELKPQETKRFMLIFEIKYPKGKSVRGL